MSARRRGATGLSGMLLVDKPAGMTSHDVVAAVRRSSGEGRVGHAGTLDPLATGLLVVLVGPATRLEPYLSAATKSYEAVITFGSATDTDDAEGAVIGSAPVPEAVSDPRWAQELLDGLVGESLQLPPVYSAIKTDGATAHRVARSGGVVERRARPVRIDEARLLSVSGETPVTWRVAFTVSKGTYIRALARDIGSRAGSLAHLSGLMRTASGSLLLPAAHGLDDVVESLANGEADRLWADPVPALGMPVLVCEPEAIADGRSLPVPPESSTAAGEAVAVVAAPGDRLAAIYRRSGDRLVPVVVLAGGVARGAK